MKPLACLTLISIMLVPYKEDGSGEGGYAKEMSAEYKKAEAEAMKGWVAAADIIITTAMIPGKPAPRLIPEDMIKNMKPGSVILGEYIEHGSV
jgi:NAD/NADP transhydrogenase alpha subunit